MNFNFYSMYLNWIIVAIAIIISTSFRTANAQTSAPLQKSPNNSVQVPQSLNANSNALQFPTRPEEVKIQTTVPITLGQALELAKRNNRDLQVSLLELERSRAALRESQAALLPTVNINGSVTNSRSTGGNESSTSFNGQAQLNYNLYTSGNRNASIRQAEEQVRVQEFTVETQASEIELNVATRYYDLQQANENVRINRVAVENAQASLRDAQARERAGVGTQFEVLQAQVNLADAQQNLITATSNQQVARRQLFTLLSLPQSVDISAAEPVQLAGLWQRTLEQSIVEALQNRPELPQFLAQRNIAEQQRRQAFSRLGPQASLVGNYNLLDRYNDRIGVTDGYSVGLQASINLFDGGAARANADQARTNIAIAEVQFANQRDQIRFNVEQYYSQLTANLENVQTSSLALEQARESLRIARLRYNAGVGTQTEVISAENDLTQAEGNRVTSILDYNRALANLQRSVTSRGSQ